MNKLSKYVLLLLVSVLAACGSDDDAAATFTPGTPQPGDALAVTITASDFMTDGAPDTRATDKGPVTTFEDGDRVGIIILDAGDTPLYNNIPYKYVSSSNTWEFDNGNGEGKEICYYDSKARTYIVYYPYSAKADDCKSENDLKAIFKPQTDQRDKEAYRASDLMVSTTTGTPLKSLKVELEHVYASISLAPITTGAKYVLEGDVAYTGNYKPNGADISKVNLTVGDDIYFLHQAADDTWRCIIPAGIGASEDVRCFYTIGSKTYGNTITIAKAGTVANTRYTSSPEIKDVTYSLGNARVGDFYCMNDKKEGYLIPNDVTALSPDQQAACVGIVFWVGSEAFDEDPLLKKDYPDCTHGLVVALQDADDGNTMNWSNKHEYIQDWVNTAGNPYKDVVNLQSADKMCGYSNTLALVAYNEAKEGVDNGLCVLPCDAIQKYAKSAPTNSSGWYFPSVMELKYVCWGQEQGQGTTGLNNLNSYIKKVGGTPFGSDFYWSSTEYNNNYSSFAWGVYFDDDGYVDYGDKDGNAFCVRPLLAF